MSELPNGWAVTSFTDVVESLSTAGHVVEASEYARDGSIPVLTQGVAELDGFTNDTSRAFYSQQTLIVFGDHTRALKLGTPPFAVGPNAKVLAPSPALVPKFLYYQLPMILPPSRGYGRHYQFLAKSRLAIAPLAEQERIVAAIEEQFSRLDDAAVALERVHRRLASLRRALLTAMVGIEWPTTMLQDVAETRLGKMLSRKSKTGSGELPYLRNQNVQWGRFDLSDVALMNFDPDQRDRFRLEVGDLLVCEGGVVGRCAIWEGQLPECYYQKALHRIRPSAAVRAKWVAMVFEHFANEGLLSPHVGGITIQHLPQEDLRRLVIPLPPLHDQDEMISRLDEHATALNSTKAVLARSEQSVKALRSSVLALAFSGKLVARDPRDESAATLIGGITAERGSSNGNGAMLHHNRHGAWRRVIV